jgi:ABC-2 type transport system ATP-binding protein
MVALVGPNGAGKSTLLGLLSGTGRPSEGSVSVYGTEPPWSVPDPRISFLAQHKPLYPQFTVAQMLRFGRSANPGWDQEYAERLVEQARVPLTAKVSSLSGGQRTRVALAVALGTRPRLLLLDESLADLDPLARTAVLELLRAEQQRQAMTVVLSSHVLAELEEVCDHLVLLTAGRARLAGDIAGLVAGHAILTGPPDGPLPVPPRAVIDAANRPGVRQLLVSAPFTAPPDPRWRWHRPKLGQLVLGYLRSHEEVTA